MSMITLNVIGDFITGSYNGKNFGVKFEENLHKQMLALQVAANSAESIEKVEELMVTFERLTVEDFKSTIEGASSFLHVNPMTNETFLKANGIVSNVPMPSKFVDRLNLSLEKGIDIEPMIKFWIRLLRNPKLTRVKLERIVNYISITWIDHALVKVMMDANGISEDVARERATMLQVSITNEGLLETYKVSREVLTKFDKKTGEEVERYEVTFDENTGIKTYEELDVEDMVFEPVMQRDNGDAFYAGDKLGHHIIVGKVHKLESWDMVNCNDNSSCVPGLHVGNMDYIKGYQNDDTVTHRVFVDPMYIGAVPNDDSGAIRCKEYMVHGTLDKITKNIYNSSTYAAQTNAEWQEMADAAVKGHEEFLQEKTEEAIEASNQIESLSI